MRKSLETNKKVKTSLSKIDWSNSVLVTGAHRSGTTWVGRVLSQDIGNVYIHEPFSPNQQIGKSPIKYFYQYFSGGQDFSDVIQLEELLYHRIYFSNKYLLERMSAGKVKDRLYFLKEGAKNRIYRKRIIKDPHAIFLCEWLFMKYQLNILIMIRHPAAFVYSLMKKKWNFDFNNFTQQPKLMNGPLQSYSNAIEMLANTQSSILEQGILLWKIIYSYVHILKSKYKDWLFVRHEDIAKNPEIEFPKIYSQLNYHWTYRSYNYLEKTINPLSGNKMSRKIEDTMDAWKTGFTLDEINLIKEGTKEVWPFFYVDKDWKG